MSWLWIVLIVYFAVHFIVKLYGRSDTNFLTRFMIFLFPWLYFMQRLLQEYEEQETWWQNQYQMG